MNSLRQANSGVSASAKKSNKGSATALTIDNPPSFYDDDQRKWREKFVKSVRAREQYKKTYHAKEARSVFTSNDEKCADDPDKNLADVKYTGGQLMATKSEFKRVIGRRKSR